MITEATFYQQLNEQYGFDSFRPGQLETLTALAADQHVLSIMPTGAGKSLIYELYGRVTQQLVVVVSPLIALMQDQVATMNYHGEKRVTALTSMMPYGEKTWTLAHLDNYRYLFVSPEMLTQEKVLARLSQLKIGLFVVDEAHCISTWGPDFRPEYLLLGQTREQLGAPLTLMLTATATPRVREDIKQRMRLPAATEITQPIDRPNIYLQVETVADTSEKQQRLVALVSQLAKPGVVYFSSKKLANEMATLINDQTACRAAAYHADLADESRFKIQQQFMANQIQVVCATSAFGMGIDKNDVRFVIHYHLPVDIENYWQEVGRAGRDGKQAIAVMLYQPGDEQIADFLSQAGIPSDDEIHFYFQQAKLPEYDTDPKATLVWFYKQHGMTEAQVRELFTKRLAQRNGALQQMVRYVRTDNCKRRFITGYFGQAHMTQPEACCVSDTPTTIADLGLETTEQSPVRSGLPDWQTVLNQLFLRKK